MPRHPDRGSVSSDLRVVHLKKWDPDADPSAVTQCVDALPGVRRTEFHPDRRRLIVLGTCTEEDLRNALHGLGLELEAGEEDDEEPEASDRRIPRPQLSQILGGARRWLVPVAVLVPASFLVGVFLSVLSTMQGPPPSQLIGGLGILLLGIGLLLGHRVVQRLVPFPGAQLGRVDTALVVLIVLVAQVVGGHWLQALILLGLYTIVQLVPRYLWRSLETRVQRPLKALPDQVQMVGDGETYALPASAAVPGQVIYVEGGNVVPLDGQVVSGEAVVNAEVVTGEAIPFAPSPGAMIFAGSLVESGELYVRVERPADQALLRQLRPVDLLHLPQEEALGGWAGKMAQHFTRMVIYVATAVMVVPPLVLGEAVGPWLQHGLALLLLAPINTLVFSHVAPLISARVRLAEIGSTVPSSTELHALGRSTVLGLTPSLVMDARRILVGIQPYSQLTEGDALQIGASLLAEDPHPVGLAFREAAVGQGVELLTPISAEPFDGQGMTGTLRFQGHLTELKLGSTLWTEEHGVRLPDDLNEWVEEAASEGANLLWLTSDEHILAVFLVQSRIKDGSRRVVHRIHKLGVRRVVMLSKLEAPVVDRLAQQAGLDEGYGRLSNLEIEQLLQSWHDTGEASITASAASDPPLPGQPDVHVTLEVQPPLDMGPGKAAVAAHDWAQLVQLIALGKSFTQVSRYGVALAIVFKAGMAWVAVRGLPSLWLIGALEALGTIAVAAFSLRLLRRI